LTDEDYGLDRLMSEIAFHSELLSTKYFKCKQLYRLVKFENQKIFSKDNKDDVYELKKVME
jgi:hypothetical protein